MEKRTNRRDYDEHVVKSQHLKLDDLIEKAWRKGLSSKYLYKENIPASPRPEFHVSHLKHDTNRDGLRGIKTDEGFRNPGRGSLLWWSLAVGPDEITSAERRLLETTFPDRTEEQVQMQQSFLEVYHLPGLRADLQAGLVPPHLPPGGGAESLQRAVLQRRSARHAGVRDRPVQKGSDVRCAGPQPSQSGAVL